MQFHEDKVKLIAEIGGNHEGDYNYALDLLGLAIESGVDSIKFQIYSGETLVNESVDKQRKEHFDKFTFSNYQYKNLADICISNGVDFSASIWNNRQLDIFDDCLSFYKIGSGDLTAYPLIEHLCQKGKPIILSTGLSELKEVIDTVDFICSTNPKYKDAGMLCIMQCTSSYPTPDNELNLKVIQSYKDIFPFVIGFSCHSTNPYAIDYSIALGARVVEFHFTDTREGKDFRDHQVSLTREEVQDLRKRIPFILESSGGAEKKPTNSEISSDHVNSFRRSSYPKKPIKAGQIVKLEDFTFLRPQEGISAKEIYSYLGLKAARDLSELEILSPEDFE